MGEVGTLVGCWSRFEQALTEAILRNEGARAGDWGRVEGFFSERLSRWKSSVPTDDRSLLDEIADQARKLGIIRNQIVHGLCGGSAMPAEGSEACIYVVAGGWRKPGEQFVITVSQLRHYCRAIEACNQALSTPILFTYRL